MACGDPLKVLLLVGLRLIRTTVLKPYPDMGLGLGREIRDEVQLATPTEGPFLGYVGTSLKSEQHAEVSRLVLLLLHGLTRFVTRSRAAMTRAGTEHTLPLR